MRNATPAQTHSNAESRAEFRHLMGRFATGVCVVSVRHGDSGKNGGDSVAAMTINSFVSVSLDPILISWNLHNSSSQFGLFAGAEQFGISILAEGQADLARRYASRADSALRYDDFVDAEGGAPVIDGALAYLECRRWSEYPAGDHTVIFGEVSGMSPNMAAKPAPALGFFNGQFCSVGES